MPEDVIDIKLNTEKDISLDNTNDFAVTGAEESVLQSVNIHVENVLDNYLGETITSDTMNSLATSLSEDIQSLDPQITRVDEINISTDDNTVGVEIVYVFNNEFQTVQVTENAN